VDRPPSETTGVNGTIDPYSQKQRHSAARKRKLLPPFLENGGCQICKGKQDISSALLIDCPGCCALYHPACHVPPITSITDTR
jgi:hypothetical protein